MLGRLLVAVLVLALVAPAPGSAAAAQPSDEIDPDSVLLHVALQPNGSAEWRIEYRYHLDDANETAAFESMRREIRADPRGFSKRFRERLADTVAAAENDTGRGMSLGPVDVSARRQSIPQETGIVSYRFSWGSFAVVEDGRIAAGDALRGFYMDAETTLTMSWPAGYGVDAVAPAPDDRDGRQVVWTGERQFVGDQPRLVLLPETPTPTSTETAATAEPATGTSTRTPAGAGSGEVPISLTVGGVALLAAAVAAGLVLRRRRQPAAGPAPDDELLSDEERVLTALDDAGGRMRQQELADACDWTTSKTSKVINRLRDEGTVKVFRLGRENVVTLPEEGYDED